LIQLCPYLQFSTMSTLKFYGDSNWPKIHWIGDNFSSACLKHCSLARPMG
jgi:hypothetical protein